MTVQAWVIVGFVMLGAAVGGLVALVFREIKGAWS